MFRPTHLTHRTPCPREKTTKKEKKIFFNVTLYFYLFLKILFKIQKIFLSTSSFIKTINMK